MVCRGIQPARAAGQGVLALGTIEGVLGQPGPHWERWERHHRCRARHRLSELDLVAMMVAALRRALQCLSRL